MEPNFLEKIRVASECELLELLQSHPGWTQDIKKLSNRELLNLINRLAVIVTDSGNSNDKRLLAILYLSDIDPSYSWSTARDILNLRRIPNDIKAIAVQIVESAVFRLCVPKREIVAIARLHNIAEDWHLFRSWVMLMEHYLSLIHI